MKKIRIKYLLIFSCVFSIILVNFSVLLNRDLLSSSNIKKSQPRLSQEPFELIQDFEPSTYYISPESSPGDRDNVFFSFMANKDGNYTLLIKNYPGLLTTSSNAENYLAFDNPSGTNLWYLSYVEFEDLDFGQLNIKLMISDDKGQTWFIDIPASFSVQGGFFKISRYLLGSAVAAYPSRGLIGIITWVDTENLMYIGSEDNGTTWNAPAIIASKSQMGCDTILIDQNNHPKIDIAILKNGTIYVVSEADDDNFTDIVYVESQDNGNTWSTVRNVTSTANKECRKPKIQVDHNSGDYWLMWRVLKGVTPYDKNQWAEFNESVGESLSSNVAVDNVTNRLQKNYDFIYDSITGIFRVLQVNQTHVINWTCSNFGEIWSNNSLGPNDALPNSPASFDPNYYFNMIYDGKTYHYFFKAEYTGNVDLYHYVFLENPNFWTRQGNFMSHQLEQIFWNGRINDIIPINNTMVKVEFTAQNNSDTIDKEFYLIIDNKQPQFNYFEQKLEYFNPNSGNLEWNILPSEPCTSVLQIFREDIGVSNWNRVTDNNWQDSNPRIFVSNVGQLFIIYETLEAGRTFLYLTKSWNKGITWTEPVKIFEASLGVPFFHITPAAWEDVVVFYLNEEKMPEHWLMRSFDQGETFQDPIPLHDLGFLPIPHKPISGLTFTENGTLFLTVRKFPFNRTYVYRSGNLGINWTLSNSWLEMDGYSYGGDDPDITYDPINNLIHVIMPQGNFSWDVAEHNFANFTFISLNLTSNTWGAPISIGNFSIGSWGRTSPKFMLTRDTPESPVKIRTIYRNGFNITGGGIVMKEIVSTDLGQTWSNATQISIQGYYSFTSDLDEIYYTIDPSDGNDKEIEVSREGHLILINKESLSSTMPTKISFDGIDDFGDQIQEGGYGYVISLIDYAGNRINREGWFYADYNSPDINNHSTNWDIPITPRHDVNVMVDIQDGIDFSAYLYYKRDEHEWQNISMIPNGEGKYSAIIFGDERTESVEYYIKATDLAGNEMILNNDGPNFEYHMPNYVWGGEIFNETLSYSSGRDYTFEIAILNDFQFVQKVFFKYSFDGGTTWNQIEMIQRSPVFVGTLSEIPEDLRTLYYQIVVLDIYGQETSLHNVKQISFYPEIPSFALTFFEYTIICIMAIAAGFVIAYGYIRLKRTSRDIIHKQIIISRLYEEMEEEISLQEQKKEKEKEKKQIIIGTTPFTKAYLGILCATITVFVIGFLLALLFPQIAIILFLGSLLMGIFGYMILMSRDITANIYLEKIRIRLFLLEMFQMGFLFFNIIELLLVGSTIPWFNYYLIEETILEIPSLYISVIGVFFTTLVLVIIITYLQLRNSVKNIRNLRKEGASDNLLLYNKDQTSSRMITQMGYKTVVFLISVLVAVITTIPILLTPENTILLLIIAGPFAVSCFLVLMIHPVFEKRAKKKKEREMQMPFIDSKKFCVKCGESMFLADKFCVSCGERQIFSQKMGTYIARCDNCEGLIYETAEFCPKCGKKINLDTQ